MAHQVIATTLWAVLGASLALTVAGLDRRSSRALFAAAALSFCFAVVAMFSIGIFVLPCTVFQIIAAIVIRRERRRSVG